MKRKRPSGVVSAKKPKNVQSWDRDIICLPQECYNSHHVNYPRGKYRARLGSNGLVGKIHLTSDMTVQDVEREVRSVFHGPMRDREDFPFVFLQPTGAGSRSLTIPSVSTSFSWTAQQVARLSGTKGSIYILAKDDLSYPDSEVSD